MLLHGGAVRVGHCRFMARHGPPTHFSQVNRYLSRSVLRPFAERRRYVPVGNILLWASTTGS